MDEVVLVAELAIAPVILSNSIQHLHCIFTIVNNTIVLLLK